MREMDQNRKSGTVTGMPGVMYWQDGCFFCSDFKFVKSEYPETDPQKEALKDAMKEDEAPAAELEVKMPGSIAYSTAYKAAMSLSVSALKAGAVKLAGSIGSYDGVKITVFSGAGSKQKNAKTVAMFG